MALRRPALRRPALRPTALVGLVAAGAFVVAGAAPQAMTTAAVPASQQRITAYSAPSLAEHIEERREVAVSRSGVREAPEKAAAEASDSGVVGSAKAKALPDEKTETGTPGGDEDTTDAPKASGSSSSGGLSSAPCASGSGMESGLTSNAIAVHRAVCAQFPSVTSYGGMRSGDGGEHGTGHAVDIMVSGSTGDAIAAYVRSHAGALGVTEVIWSQRIWTTQRSSEGWRSMEDRGSTTANHYDHVHVTVG